MKRLCYIAALLICVFAFSGCAAVSSHLTSNVNTIQTNVVLSEANFHVVKQVEESVSATYVFGIGGMGKKHLCDAAVERLVGKANLQGSQALVNVTVRQTFQNVLFFYQKVTTTANGLVVEFDE